jgi:hypothetical protein
MSADDEPHDWESCLKEGNKWEDRIKPTLKEQILSITVDQVSFDDDPEKQLSGIDHVLTRESPNIDVKVRDYDYYGDDILIETVSVVERDSKGWLYSDGLDVLAYCWKNRADTNLVDGLLLLINDAFIQWFEAHKSEFRAVTTQTKDGRETWTTRSRIVEIDRIPEGFIYTDFDPTLPTTETTAQRSITDFGGGGDA